MELRPRDHQLYLHGSCVCDVAVRAEAHAEPRARQAVHARCGDITPNSCYSAERAVLGAPANVRVAANALAVRLFLNVRTGPCLMALRPVRHGLRNLKVGPKYRKTRVVAFVVAQGRTVGTARVAVPTRVPPQTAVTVDTSDWYARGEPAPRDPQGVPAAPGEDYGARRGSATDTVAVRRPPAARSRANQSSSPRQVASAVCRPVVTTRAAAARSLGSRASLHTGAAGVPGFSGPVHTSSTQRRRSGSRRGSRGGCCTGCRARGIPRARGAWRRGWRRNARRVVLLRRGYHPA